MTDQIQTIEVSMEEARETLELQQSLLRLYKNNDFQKIILEGYFRDEPVRVTAIMGQPVFTEPGKRDRLHEVLMGPAMLHEYFRTISKRAMMAEKAIQDHEEALREAEVEGVA